MIYNIRLAAAAFAGLSLTAVAAPKFEEMDYGRFITTSFDNTKGQNTLKGNGCTVNKGMAIQLGAKEGCMLFDTDLCRWAGGWTGGYITYKGVIFDGAHGPNASAAKGANLVFETNPTPTWSKGGSFADPRSLPKGEGAAKVPFGPLPKDWVKFKGTFVSGDNVVVAYTVGTASLLEMAALEKAGDTTLLTRTVNVIAAGAGAENILWQGADAPSVVGKHIAVVRTLDAVTVITVLGSGDSELALTENRVVWKVPSFSAGSTFKIAYAKGTLADEAKLIAAAHSATLPADLRAFTKGGAPRWKETVTTKLIAGTPAEQDAYVVDTIEVPFTNPYKAWMRIGAFDFMKDGRIVVGTWSGDVWMISDVNTAPKWQRIATGLFQALGVKVVDEKIYIHGREGITRLNDLNGDGEVDFYENFNNDIQTTPGFHEFAFDLQTDSKGNFFFAKGGPVNSGGSGFSRSAITRARFCGSRPMGKSSMFSPPACVRQTASASAPAMSSPPAITKARGCRNATSTSSKKANASPSPTSRTWSPSPRNTARTFATCQRTWTTPAAGKRGSAKTGASRKARCCTSATAPARSTASCKNASMASCKAASINSR